MAWPLSNSRQKNLVGPRIRDWSSYASTSSRRQHRSDTPAAADARYLWRYIPLPFISSVRRFVCLFLCVRNMCCSAVCHLGSAQKSVDGFRYEFFSASIANVAEKNRLTFDSDPDRIPSCSMRIDPDHRITRCVRIVLGLTDMYASDVV